MILCLDKYLVGILGNRRETTARKLAKVQIGKCHYEFTKTSTYWNSPVVAGCPML